jgi:hypothetical protein
MKDIETNKGSKKKPCKSENLISQDKVKIIRRAAELAAFGNESKKHENQKRIDNLLSKTSELSLLLNYSRGYLKGDSISKDKLLALLNHLVQRIAPVQSKSKATAHEMPNPFSDELKNLSLTVSFLGGLSDPCFIGPSAIGDIFLGVLRLIEEYSPGFGNPGCPLYLDAVSYLVEDVSDLEILYIEAKAVVLNAACQETFDTFNTTLALMDNFQARKPLGTAGYIKFVYGNPNPVLFGLEMPQGILDICRAMKWDRTRKAVECINRLRHLSSYRINNIINVTRSTEITAVNNRACEGDLIEILGVNFSEDASVVFNASVIFPGGIQASEYYIRERGRIRCRVPIGTISGDVLLQIPVFIPECPNMRYGLGNYLSNNFLVIERPAVIEEFTIQDFIGTIVDQEHARIEACTSYKLKIVAHNAERVTVTNGHEDLIFEQDGPDVDELLQIDANENGTYSLVVLGFCGQVSRQISVELYKAIHLTLIGGNQIQGGQTFEVNARISCPAPAGGLALRLFDSPGITFADGYEPVISEGNNNYEGIRLLASEGAYETWVNIDALGHESDAINILVYGNPIITDITPRQVPECSSFEIEISGSSFDIEPSANEVYWSGNIPLEVAGIHYPNPVDRMGQAVLEVRGDDIACGVHNIFVNCHSLASERARLEVTPMSTSGHCKAQIKQFEAIPSSVDVSSSETPIRLRGTVFKARSIRITSDVLGLVYSHTYAPMCVDRDFDFELPINESHTFTLEASQSLMEN